MNYIKKSIDDRKEVELFRNSIGEVNPLKQEKYCFPPKKKHLSSALLK